MTIDWTIVPTDGFDVEDVLDPRSLTDVCPACEKRVRLVERQLVKNLKVFSLPLLAVEHGARVFQCPHCEACFEPPPVETVPSRTEPATASPPPEVTRRIEELQGKLTRAEDELELWRLRVDLATRKGETSLAREARDLLGRYQQAANALRTEIARLRGAPLPEPPPPPESKPLEVSGAPVVIPAPPPPPEPAPEPTKAEVEDEMAALKRKLRKRD